MAAPYQVNISIGAGTGFAQEFSIANPDGSPVVITGFKFFGNLAKHPTAIDAIASTSGSMVYDYFPFTTRIVNGNSGVYEISMSPGDTAKLQEGKYVYNVVMQDSSGDKTSVISGLAFVDVAFGSI
jgi:hypothetical protein